MLACGSCGMSFPFNPLNTTDADALADVPLRTPISGVNGYVSFMETGDEKFYGCGETGAVWRSDYNLHRDIELIMNRYPHRRLCYVQTDNGWTANAQEPPNMDELIDQEEKEELRNFEQD